MYMYIKMSCCRCWYTFAEEAKATVNTIFAKCILCCIPVALLITLYFPIRAMTIDPKNTDYIVYITIIGGSLLVILSVAIAICCTVRSPRGSETLVSRPSLVLDSTKPKSPQPPTELPTRQVIVPPRTSSAKAPKLPAIHEEEEFEAPNPLRTTRHGPVWPPKS